MRTAAPLFPRPEKPPQGWYRGWKVQKKPRIPVPGQATPPEEGVGVPGSLAGETGPERCPLGSGIALVLALGSPFIPSLCLAWGQLPEPASGGCPSSAGKICTEGEGEDEETAPVVTDT